MNLWVAGISELRCFKFTRDNKTSKLKYTDSLLSANFISFSSTSFSFSYNIFPVRFFLPFNLSLKTTDELFDLHINNADAFKAIGFCCCCFWWCLHLCSTQERYIGSIISSFCCNMSNGQYVHVCVSFFRSQTQRISPVYSNNWSLWNRDLDKLDRTITSTQNFHSFTQHWTIILYIFPFRRWTETQRIWSTCEHWNLAKSQCRNNKIIYKTQAMQPLVECTELKKILTPHSN